MKEITVKIIYDNCKENCDLQEGWGFSAAIYTGSSKILFDTGNDSAAFFSNSQKMGIDYEDITQVVFSHKHSDHVSGSNQILQKLKKNTPVFLPHGFPIKKNPRKRRGSDRKRSYPNGKRGVLLILESATERLNKPVYYVLGGWHLFRKSRSFIEEVTRKFLSLGIQKVAPCHCSGEQAIKYFQKAYLENFYKIGTGSVLTIS